MDYAPEKVAAIFDIIAQNHINLDIINQNILGDKIAFSFSAPTRRRTSCAPRWPNPPCIRAARRTSTAAIRR